MSKRDFIALADAIREHNRIVQNFGKNILGYVAPEKFTSAHLEMLADFCQSQNSNFKRDRWLSYIAGECGPNGGAR
jgi:hypothetical protein